MAEYSPDKMQATHIILNAIPCSVFIADKDARILFANKAAEGLAGGADLRTRPLCGRAISCVHALESVDACGTTPYCAVCGCRNAVNAAYAGKTVVRSRAKVHVKHGEDVYDLHLLVSSSRLDLWDGESIALTIEDISEMVELRGLLPICSRCKKVRNDQQYWEHVETFLSERTDLRFTHGLCPDCFQQMYPKQE